MAFSARFSYVLFYFQPRSLYCGRGIGAYREYHVIVQNIYVSAVEMGFVILRIFCPSQHIQPGKAYSRHRIANSRFCTSEHGKFNCRAGKRDKYGAVIHGRRAVFPDAKISQHAFGKKRTHELLGKPAIRGGVD
jgi:hypothetical protein